MVDVQTYKSILSRWSSGVTVVTVKHEGLLHGTTVSSFTSVSLQPPLISICIAHRLFMHSLLEQSAIFAVNLLSSEQVEWGKRFAGMYPEIEDRFADIAWFEGVTGCPILPDTLGWLDCRLYRAYEGGDHTIFLGEVLAGAASEDSNPLVYHHRQWGKFISIEN